MARVSLRKGMKINDAKKFVADKLKISTFDLSDEEIMQEVREDLRIGGPLARPGASIGMEAKVRIAELLGFEIKSVSNFLEKSGLR